MGCKEHGTLVREMPMTKTSPFYTQPCTVPLHGIGTHPQLYTAGEGNAWTMTSIEQIRATLVFAPRRYGKTAFADGLMAQARAPGPNKIGAYYFDGRGLAETGGDPWKLMARRFEATGEGAINRNVSHESLALKPSDVSDFNVFKLAETIARRSSEFEKIYFILDELGDIPDAGSKFIEPIFLNLNRFDNIRMVILGGLELCDIMWESDARHVHTSHVFVQMADNYLNPFTPADVVSYATQLFGLPDPESVDEPLSAFSEYVALISGGVPLLVGRAFSMAAEGWNVPGRASAWGGHDFVKGSPDVQTWIDRFPQSALMLSNEYRDRVVAGLDVHTHGREGGDVSYLDLAKRVFHILGDNQTMEVKELVAAAERAHPEFGKDKINFFLRMMDGARILSTSYPDEFAHYSLGQFPLHVYVQRDLLGRDTPMADLYKQWLDLPE